MLDAAEAFSPVTKLARRVSRHHPEAQRPDDVTGSGRRRQPEHHSGARTDAKFTPCLELMLCDANTALAKSAKVGDRCRILPGRRAVSGSHNAVPRCHGACTTLKKMMCPSFSYSQAFARNIGWLAAHEQEILRHKRVAIAGMGGVGGVHLLTLTRLGIGAFNIADFDTFDIQNFNRQAGAMMSTVDKLKIEVMADQALDINPEMRLKAFPEGVTTNNIDEFLDNVDLYVDGLDFFAFDMRQALFAACARRAIPAITAAPIGMGAAVLNFMPGGMTFEDYFGWGDLPETEKALRFVVGLAPAGLNRAYLVDPSAVNLAERRTPSTVMACQICAGVAATEALKILLQRGRVRAAPHGLQFDAYLGRLALTWRPGGNRNPLQRLAIAIGRRHLGALNQAHS